MTTITHRLALAGAILAAACGGALGANRKAPVPSGAEARAVCAMISARGPKVSGMLVESGVLDANNDGVPDAVTVAMRDGTMRGEDLQFRPRGAAKDSKPVDVTPKDFQPGDYLPFGARWLPYGGRVYTLYFDAEDQRSPSYLGYIDAANAEHLVCDFTSDEHEMLRAVGGRGADALCRTVAQGGASYAPVVEVQEADPDHTTDRWMSRVAGRITVDFDNSGQKTPLALLAFESGAGRGCVFSYFDRVADGKIAASGDAHASLMKLQDVELSDQGSQVYTSGRCDGSVPRWFARDGLTYLDIAGGPDLRRSSEPFHEVRLLRGTQVETLCKADFKVSWKVKSMAPEFR